MIATCPSCKARYRLETSRLKGGRGRLKCARCGEVFAVGEAPPQPAAAPPAPPAAPSQPEAAAPPAAVGQGNAVKRLLKASKTSKGGLAVAIVACEPGPLRESLVSALARSGVRTLTTDDGPTCLDMARRTRPKLIVSASYLPGLTGPELAGALRGEPALARSRIVLLAAAGDEPPPAGAVDADVVLPSTGAVEKLTELVPELLADGSKEHSLEGDQLRLLERQARVAARELGLYHPQATDREALEAEADETRAWLATQWPSCPKLACELFDAELQ